VRVQHGYSRGVKRKMVNQKLTTDIDRDKIVRNEEKGNKKQA
jgi:hypothetical protein